MRATLIALAIGSALIATSSADVTSDPPSPTITVSGIVELVREDGLDGCELCDACSDCGGTHVLLQTGSRHREVHLAPAWFLSRLQFWPLPGDAMHVTGTRIRLLDGHGVGAHDVRVGATTFRLRDEHGLPLWRRMLTDAGEAACGAARGDEPRPCAQRTSP